MLPNSSLVHFKKDEILFRQGDSSRELYLIHSGTVQVFVTKNTKMIPITEMGKDSVVGEMSFVSGIPRTATAVAKTPVIASVVGVEVLSDEVFGLSNWCLSLAKGLVQKLHKATVLLEDMTSTRGDEAGQAWDSLAIQQRENRAKGRLFLIGSLTGKDVNTVKEKVREMKAKGHRPVILDFSQVIDVDREGMEYLSLLIQSGAKDDPEVVLENVQLVRNKLLALQGIMKIISTTQMPLRRVNQGEFLIRQNQLDTTMYVVKSGKFKVFREVEGKEVVFFHAEEGDVLGEMALIKEGNRSASVQAEKSSVVYVIEAAAFHDNRFNVPDWFMKVLLILISRIRSTNLMVDYLVQNQKKKTDKKKWAAPLGILLDHENPGEILLQGHLVLENMEYLYILIRGMQGREIQNFVLDLSRVKEVEQEALRFLLGLVAEVEARGGTLKIEGPQKNLVTMIKEYARE